jgi:hypothetical protein
LTAESCFFKRGSTSKLLHELILRLKKAEIQYGFVLHMVHIAGTCMIEQGTDSLSRGSFLEGVLAGKDMLSYVDLSHSAVERYPKVLDYVQSWLTNGRRRKAVEKRRVVCRGPWNYGRNQG